MLKKDETVLATGDRIYAPLNWAYITVTSMENSICSFKSFGQCIFNCFATSDKPTQTESMNIFSFILFNEL